MKRRQQKICRSAALCCGALSLLGLIPIVISLATEAAPALHAMRHLDSPVYPVLRSLFLIAVCSPLCSLGGFFVGAAIADTRTIPNSRTALLLLPMLLGGGVGAFVFKLCFVDIDFVGALLRDRNLFAFWSSEVAMFYWQYFPAAVFFSWLNCLQIKPEAHEFASAHRISFGDRLCDIYWPQCRPLLFYIFLLLAAASAAEFERSALVFRASPGTNTEFFSHWLLRSYFVLSRIDPLAASASVMVYQAAFLALFISWALLLAFAMDRGAPVIFRQAAFGFRTLHRRTPQVLLAGLGAVVVLPLLPTLVRGCRMVQMSEVGSGLLLVLPPVGLMVLIAVTFSVCARIAWPSRLERFGTGTVAACMALAAVGFLPPIGLAFSGTWWLQRTGIFTGGWLLPLWWLLLVIGTLPTFLPGFFALQFGVSTRELSFQFQSRASTVEIAIMSFVRRNWPAYALFSCFAITALWSEYPLTSLFGGLSERVQTPMLLLALRIEGKGAEFNEAAAIILQIGLPALLSAMAFGHWLKRRAKIESA